MMSHTLQPSVDIYPSPEGIDPSPDYEVRVNGQDVFVYHTPVASVAPFAFEGEVEIEIRPLIEVRSMRVRPMRHGVEPRHGGDTWRFRLSEPCHLSVEINDELLTPLFLFADPPETERPDPDDDGVHYFESGRIHDVGALQLEAGESIYIEGGAVVRGAIRADRLDNVRIRGRGVFQSRRIEPDFRRAVQINDCRGVLVEGITFLESQAWTVCPFGSRDVTVRNVKIVNVDCGRDGIDLLGTQDALVEDCFIRTNDDCIVLKAGGGWRGEHPYGHANVERIHVRRCTLWNAACGNALEIGYETRCAYMRDIRFEDIDIIHAEFEGWSSGAAISIHNGDRAVIDGVVYENIRIEDAREKLFDFRVLHAQYTRDKQKGQIRNIRVKDVAVIDGVLPPSLLDGWWERNDDSGKIQNVWFENVTYRGTPLLNPVDAKMVICKAGDIYFHPGPRDATDAAWEL